MLAELAPPLSAQVRVSTPFTRCSRAQQPARRRANHPARAYTGERYFLAARLGAVDLDEPVDAVRPLAALRVAVFRVGRLF
jgi:hypothetical protein